MASPRSKLLLGIHLTSLHASSSHVNMSLPRRRSKVLEATWGRVIEDLLDLFKRLLRRLWEQEEDVDEHGDTEDAEDDVHLPTDVCKRRWHEVCKSEVESCSKSESGTIIYEIG